MLMEKENERIISQNNLERERQRGNSCFDTASYDAKILKDCRTCQNMSCRVESYEKPVEDCFGYIHNHKESKEENILKLIHKNN